MPAELKRCKRITYCKFCRAEGAKVRAIWMTKYPPAYAMRDWYKHYACDAHKHLIEDTDPNRTRAVDWAEPSQNAQYDEHMSEADYQTWGRL